MKVHIDAFSSVRTTASDAFERRTATAPLRVNTEVWSDWVSTAHLVPRTAATAIGVRISNVRWRALGWNSIRSAPPSSVKARGGEPSDAW